MEDFVSMNMDIRIYCRREKERGVICMTNCNSSVPCPVLRYGNRGSAVAYVQNLLRKRRYTVRVDGLYGNMTRNAVMAFQRNNNITPTGMVDSATWRSLGVTCLPGSCYPSGNADMPQILPSFPDTPAYPGSGDIPQTLPSFPDTPVYQPSGAEPGLDGLNYTWEEIGDFRYILTTNKARYARGEDVRITFRKRNISADTIVLRYPSEELFDFYISNVNGQEIYRFSDNIVDTSLPREVVMAPGQAETAEFVWNQVTSNGQWVLPQQLTLWGVNRAVGISIPLPFRIY
jgi:hypothetical protein